MKNSLVNLTYEIELKPGEKLTLPVSREIHAIFTPFSRTKPQYVLHLG